MALLNQLKKRSTAVTVFPIWLLVLQLCILSQGICSLSLTDVQNRRHFIVQGAMVSVASAATSTILPSLQNALASEIPQVDNDYRDAVSLLDANTISWTTKPGETLLWNKSRYRSSTLSTNSNNSAPPPSSPTFYPEWMEGYWSVNYKFNGASFPQGRKILSLRTAGAGLGTCLSLPNVGYNPPAHSAHFLKSDIGVDKSLFVYEDLAYNFPRKFEAFWPQSKVLSVQTNGYRTGHTKEDEYPPKMSPKCFVTGDGCTKEENKNLNLPASRLVMDFDGPTRRSGRLTQSCDVSLVENSCGLSGDAYAVTKSYSQFNINQELQTFYKEIASFEKINQNGNMIAGKVRVAAFLPKYIKEFDAGNDSGDYDENTAVAIYDYKVFMKSIDEIEAASL